MNGAGMAGGAAAAAMTNLVDGPVAACIHYIVQIDSFDLGAFNACSGLGVELVVEQREEGGNNGMVWQLPTRLRYSNVKLTRPVTPMTLMLTNWINHWVVSGERRTAVIQALGPLGPAPIASWSLVDVMPVRWTGPEFNPARPEVATETLELAHHGFLGPGWGL